MDNFEAPCSTTPEDSLVAMAGGEDDVLFIIRDGGRHSFIVSLSHGDISRLYQWLGLYMAQHNAA